MGESAQMSQQICPLEIMTTPGRMKGPATDPNQPPVWPAFTPDPSERKFLQGPHPRRHELRQAMRIFAECIRGFRALHFVGPCVTVFGSARFDETHAYYALGEELGAELAKLGVTVMNGGGPGLMEAANRGAKRAGGLSIGCCSPRGRSTPRTSICSRSPIRLPMPWL
jgi:hypothetical protein